MDTYEKIDYSGFERPEYILKNGKARNCYGLLIDVHELQEIITTQEVMITELEERSNKVKVLHQAIMEKFPELWEEMVAYQVEQHGRVFCSK